MRHSILHRILYFEYIFYEVVILDNFNIDKQTIDKVNSMLNNGNLNDLLSQIPPDALKNFSTMMNGNTISNEKTNTDGINAEPTDNSNNSNNSTFDFSKIDMNTIWYAAPSGRIKSNDETWAIQNFYKVNKGEATEAELKAEKELIEKIQGSPYYQPLKEAMEKWESYYNEKYNPRNEKNKLEQKAAIYNQILDLNKNNKLSDKEKLSNLLSDARNKNIFTTEELKELGLSEEEIVNYKRISLYDEVLINPDLSKAE